MAIKKILLILGITLIFTVFFGYAAEVVFEQPKYPCEPPVKDLPAKPQEPYENYARQVDAYYSSEEYRQCQDNYDQLIEKINFKSFIGLSIVSIIAILIGLILTLEAISSGILGGGILLLVYSVMRHWGILNKYFRLAILGVALVVLLYYGYKKVDKAQKKR